jgi:histidinol dehydrogenase
MIKPETIKGLNKDKKRAIMERSMEDISSVYEGTSKILKDIKENGDAVALRHYTKHKEDISSSDLEATKEEIQQAYDQVDSKVVDCLKVAAENIIKFHTAQREREMWFATSPEGPPPIPVRF